MNWSKRSQYEEEINKEEELKKDKGEAVDVGFGDWLLGSGSAPFQGVAGVNPGIAHIK